MLISNSSSHKLRRVAAIGFAAIISIGLASCTGAGFGPPELQQDGTPDLIVGSPSASDSGPVAGVTFTLRATVRNLGDGASAATTLRYYRSTDATITTSDTLVGTDAVAALAASGSSSESVDVTAPATAGTYYYGACVDPVTDESDTTNNCSTSLPINVQITVTEPEGHPDLVVAAPTVSDSGPAAGATFTLSATVRNAGDGASAATTLRYYRSTDATITASDTEAGTDAVAALAPAGGGSESVDLTAPASPGTYYYGACVDPVADESDTTNNCSTSLPVNVQITVTEPEGHPDLEVAAPSVSDSGPAAGATFTLSATVRNEGEGAAAATTLRYYRSTDATITTSDTAAGTDEVAALAASGSSSESVDVTAPATAGTYYYGACVDPVTGESDIINNCASSVRVMVSEDLEVAAPTVSDSVPAPGATFTLSVSVKSAGEGSAATTTLSIYRSTDATITTSDTLVGTVVAELATSETGSQSTRLAAATSPGTYYFGKVELHAPDTPGTYYYGACVDPVTGGAATTDNCSPSARVVVTEPDLVVAATSVSDSSPTAGASFTLSATVRNAGEGTSAATTLRYYRSTDATITTSDTAAGTDKVAGLAASGSSRQSVILVAPATAGTYYYGACVDPVTGESDITNNCSSSVTVTVPVANKPDLKIYAVVAGTNPFGGTGPGGLIQLSVGLRNDGDAAAAATTLRFYRSTDATITTADTEEGTVEIEELAASGTTSEGMDVNAPATTGTYYYGACVDAVPDESDNTNNCSPSVQVTVPDKPDLVVAAPTVSDSGPAAGASFTLSATVRNAGDGASAATTLRYYRSTDATIATSDTQVGMAAVAELAAAGSSSQSVDLTAPGTSGTYYYGACVVAVPDESDTANNCSDSVPVTVAQKSVEVTPREVTLAALGDTAALTARVLDAQGNEISGEAVSWSSNFPEVATLDAAGVVTAVVNGRATVVASASGATGAATVIVDQRVVSVDIDPGEVELTSVGDTAALTLRAFDANGHEVPYAGDIMSFAWRSADLDVAIVSSLFGLTAQAHAVGAGTTTVTVTAVTAEGGTLIGRATVTVVVEEPTYPDLEVGTPTVDDTTPETGASFTLSVAVRNAGDGESPETTLRYYRSTDAAITTSDTSVGTVAVAALAASGSSPQSVNLTAPASPGTYYYGACVDEVTDESDTTNNCSTSVAVTVADADQQGPSVEISAEDDKEWAPVGGTVDLSARVLDDEGEEITGTTVRWSSSNTAVATVDSSGVMTAVGEGTVTLTATATVSSSSTQSSMARSGAAVEKSEETVSGSVSMIVVKRATRIDISPASLSFDSVGDSAFLTATVYDEDDNVMQPTYWGWSSADRDVATADHVFSSPQVQALVKAIGEGTTTVSLSANGSATGTASVTVTLPVARVEVSPIELDFEALGATKTVTVRVLDENGVEDEDASFTWGAFCRNSGALMRKSGRENKRTDLSLRYFVGYAVRASVAPHSARIRSLMRRR